MTEAEVLAIIDGYDKLVARAQEVGFKYAAQLHTMRRDLSLPAGLHALPYGLHTPGDLEVSMDQQHVWVRWFTRGDYESEEFPTALLWGSADDIAAEVAAEFERGRERMRAVAAEQAATQERTERATFERLKAKFDPS